MGRLWVKISLTIGVIVIFVVLVFLGALAFDAFEAWVVGRVGSSRSIFDWRDLPEAVIISAVLLAGVSIFAGIYVSRNLTAPLEQLAHGAKQIGSQQYSTRLALDGSDEIVAVAQAFNDMAGELQQAETLRRQLMADVSHELRTPLTVLEGNLRASIDEVFALDKSELANMYGQVQHLIRLVNDLHDLAQAEAKQLQLQQQPTDLSALLAETVAIFQPLAVEKGVDLGLEMPAGDSPSLLLDSLRIRQVLHNLLSNALRHTPAGGDIQVQLSQTPAHQTIKIIDSGAGIAPDQLPHLFNRFYRTDRSRSRDTGGTGLGLAICKALIEAHGGEIGVESAGINQGSTFLFSLPI